MKKLLLAFALFSALPALAQYKCTVGGAVKYSDVPCAANAKNVGALQDQVTLDAQLDRARVAAQDRRQLGGIEAEKSQFARQQQRVAEAVAEQDAAVARSAARRCSHAQIDQRHADRSAAIYRDLGMQHSVNQAKKEQDAASSRVRDACN